MWKSPTRRPHCWGNQSRGMCKSQLCSEKLCGSHATTFLVDSLCSATGFQTKDIFRFFLSVSFSLSVPSPLLLPVWSELNQNRLLLNVSPVALWLVSECKQPPYCCLFSTGLMMCSLDDSGSLSAVFPLVAISLLLYVWHVFIVLLSSLSCAQSSVDCSSLCFDPPFAGNWPNSLVLLSLAMMLIELKTWFSVIEEAT